MALRNAFDGVASERTLKRILQAVNFARDPQDRMRVVTDGSSSLSVSGSTVNLYLGFNGATPLYYAATGSPTSVDAREQLAAAAHANFNANRARWTF